MVYLCASNILMKPLCCFLLTLLSVTSIAAQDYEKDESSYMYYEGTPSKAFESLYGKTSSGKSSYKGGSSRLYGPNVIKIGAVETVQGRPTLYYERAVTKSISIEVGIGVNFKPFLGFNDNGNLGNGSSNDIEVSEGIYENVSLFGLYSKNYDNIKRNLGFHYYITPKIYTNGRAPKGFYFSPGIAHTFTNFDITHSKGQSTFVQKETSKEFGVGIGIGSQFVISSTVVLDCNVMFYYNMITQERYIDDIQEMLTVKGKVPQLMYSIKIGGLWGKKKSKS